MERQVKREVAALARAVLNQRLQVSSVVESKGLLMGEPALPDVQATILEIGQADPAVENANGVLTVHMGPEQVVAFPRSMRSSSSRRRRGAGRERRHRIIAAGTAAPKTG